MKRTPINRYSIKKILEMQAEASIRIKLCERAGGIPLVKETAIYRKGQKYTYQKVECIGGLCECGCGQYATSFNGQLHPHEQIPRSKGKIGALSLKNSIMVLNSCHTILQGNTVNLKWIDLPRV